MNDIPPLLPTQAHQKPDRKMLPIVGAQIFFLMIVNLAAAIFGREDPQYAQMQQAILASVSTAGLLIISFLVAVVMSFTKSATIPSWWIALGVIALLAFPACFVWTSLMGPGTT